MRLWPSRKTFLLKRADCLIPAAVGKSLRDGKANMVGVKAIFEGANGPTTYAVEQIMTRKGIVVVPNMLVNGDGVTYSYLEWLKSIEHVAPGRMIKKYQAKLLGLIGFAHGTD